MRKFLIFAHAVNLQPFFRQSQLDITTAIGGGFLLRTKSTTPASFGIGSGIIALPFKYLDLEAILSFFLLRVHLSLSGYKKRYFRNRVKEKLAKTLCF
jgi:hypothetical protein